MVLMSGGICFKIYLRYNQHMIERVNILGVQVSAINMEQALGEISNWVENRSPHYVCVTPAHGIMDCQREPELKQIFNQSGMTTPDGMSIVWLLKLLGHSHVSRVYGPDLMLAVCRYGLQSGWRHFFYGGMPGVAEALRDNLIGQFPGLKVVGYYSPPFREVKAEEEQGIIRMILEKTPDIIWVGISTPKQEKWMAKFAHRLDTPVLIGVGAAFDFLSGKKLQAPGWVQRSGFEWLFRLLSEPGRLWKRYIRYPLFAILVFAQMLGLKRYDT